jgi:hypothetical protein
MFQMISRRNRFDMRSSSTRSSCKLFNNVSPRPHILMPLMEESMAAVAEMRFSMASSHMAWRDMIKLMANMDPKRETVRIKLC